MRHRTATEVVTAAKRLKKNKVEGNDNLQPQLLEYEVKQFIAAPRTAAEKSLGWKKDLGAVKNTYRSIRVASFEKGDVINC